MTEYNKNLKIHNTAYKNRKPAFTLIEILVSVAISSVLILVLSRVFSNGYKNYRLGQQKITNNEVATRAVSDFEKIARNTTVLESASAQGITFYAFLRDDSGNFPTKIEYSYDSTDRNLIKKVTDPVVTAGVADYTGPTETKVIADNIIDENIFRYFNAGNQLMDVIDITVVKKVEITVTVDQNPGLTPDPATQSTSVLFRSLESNL